MENKSIWYDINKTLSYDCMLNFLYGNRGGGKTFGCIEYGIKRFLKYGEQFIYLRRYDSEFEELDLFFDAHAPHFPNNEFKVNGNTLYCDGKIIGYALPLSKSTNFKSTPFPKVKLVIYDEFLIDETEPFKRYLENEPRRFLEMLETINRLRDWKNTIKVFLCGNSFSVINPYFLYFKISMPYGSTRYVKDDKLLELVQNEEYIKIKKESRMGKLIEGTEYAEYSIENKALNDTSTFIERRQGNFDYLGTIKYKNNLIGVWYSRTSGIVSMSKDVDSRCEKVYALTMEDHNENTILLKNLKKYYMFKKIFSHYKVGALIFDNQRIKTITSEIISRNLY